MAIKPVDMQIMIPRTMEAAKTTSDHNNRAAVAQQQQQAATQHRAEDSLKQVYSRPQSQNAHITEKQKENSRQGGKGKKSRQNPDGTVENEQDNHEIKMSTIDIKI